MSWLIIFYIPLLVTTVSITGNPGCYCDSQSGDCDLVTHQCNFTAHDLQFYTCNVELSVQTGDIQHYCVTGSSGSNCQSTPEVLRKCCVGGRECNKCILPDEITYDQCNALVLPSGCAPLSCDQLTPTLPTRSTELDTWWMPMIFFLAALVLVSTVFAVPVCVCIRRRRRRRRKAYKDNGMSSGSKYSTSIMQERTFAQDIEFVKPIVPIACGAFGAVFKASRYGRVLAVKKYINPDDKTCERERRIYTSGMIAHSNIVSYVCSDIRYQKHNSGRELWLVMKFYELGCVAEYLKEHTISPNQMLKILQSIADALQFLHQPFKSHYGRNHCGIAHRDLKTRNILVADNSGACVVGDFGLSVIGDDFVEGADPVIQVGTKRHMAPEILNKTLSYEFESFCQADIYAYGLVMWEVLRRVEIDGVASDYSEPYSEFLPANPTIEDVKRVVVDQRRRPELGERWKGNEVHWRIHLANLMAESWSPSPDARPSAARLAICLRKNIVSQD